jgi:predicted nucleotide-binding protein
LKLLLQIFIFFLTCFTSSAIFSAPKIVVATHTPTFKKTESFDKSEKAKIGVQQKARSSIEASQNQTTTLPQNTFLLSSYLKEENSCAFDFQKTGFPYQFKVAQFSKNLLI